MSRALAGGRFTDFTKGPLIRPMLSFALPVLFCNAFQLLYNTVDTVVIGHALGDQALAAVGSAAAVFEILMALAMGMSTGLSITVSRSCGTADGNKLRKAVAASLVIALVCTVILTAGTYILLNPLLRLLHTPEEVFPLAYEYLVPVILFLFVTMAYNLFAGFLRAVGNSVAPLIFLVISSCLNVGLDILFIVPLGMGVQGAAVATVAAQAVASVICAVYILRRARQIIPGRKDFVPDKGIYREAAFQGTSMSLMNGIVYAGGAILQIAINGMGTLIVAAHTAARRIYTIFLTPFGAINATVSTFVSQNRGADQPDRIRQGVRTAYMADVIMTLVIMAILLPGAETLVRLISGSSEAVVLYNASRYLRFVAPCYVILGVLNVTRISLQAIGQKILPVLSSVIELAGKTVFAFLAIPQFGYPAVIICEPLIWCLMVLELLLSFWLNPYIRRNNRHGSHPSL